MRESARARTSSDVVAPAWPLICWMPPSSMTKEFAHASWRSATSSYRPFSSSFSRTIAFASEFSRIQSICSAELVS